ncbi:MAG: Lrp/AsnC family transcriptional regulator [Candidatus Hodarchaeales archaeon]|jgi:DNA-binding Lrp family transcriptional regulator
MDYNLDQTDEKILTILKTNSRSSVNTISSETGIPPTTVHNRIKKLENKEIIRGYTINVNDDLVKGPIITFILIKASDIDQNTIMDNLIEHEEVEEVAIVTGENDLIVRTRVRSMDDLNEFILNHLRKIPGISSSVSMLSLKYYQKE